MSCAAESDFPIKNSTSFTKIFNKVDFTAVSMTFALVPTSTHRCATNFIENIREFEAIFEKALIRVSGFRQHSGKGDLAYIP
jgi:hypothetical protein